MASTRDFTVLRTALRRLDEAEELLVTINRHHVQKRAPLLAAVEEARREVTVAMDPTATRLPTVGPRVHFRLPDGQPIEFWSPPARPAAVQPPAPLACPREFRPFVRQSRTPLRVAGCPTGVPGHQLTNCRCYNLMTVAERVRLV